MSTQTVGNYTLERSPTDSGVWYLIDPETDRIVSTFFRSGPGVWRGTTAPPVTKMALTYEIGDDVDEPHMVMARKLAT